MIWLMNPPCAHAAADARLLSRFGKSLRDQGIVNISRHVFPSFSLLHNGPSATEQTMLRVRWARGHLGFTNGDVVSEFIAEIDGLTITIQRDVLRS